MVAAAERALRIDNRDDGEPPRLHQVEDLRTATLGTTDVNTLLHVEPELHLERRAAINARRTSPSVKIPTDEPGSP